MSVAAASLTARRFLSLLNLYRFTLPPDGVLAKGTNEALAANFSDSEFNLRSLRGGNQARFQIAEPSFFVLANQLADLLAGRAPVAGGYLAFDVFFEGFG